MRLVLTLLLTPLLAYGSAMAYLWYEVKSKTDEAIAAVAPFVEIRYDSVHTSLFGDEVGLNNIIIKPVTSQDEFRIEQVRFSGPYPGYFIISGKSLEKGEAPESLGMQIQRLHLDINSEIFTMLEQMQQQAATGQTNNRQSFSFDLDALGCGDLKTFTLNDYRQMGIGATVTDAAIDIAHDKTFNRLKLTAKANTEGLYKVESSFDIELNSKGMIAPAMYNGGIPKIDLKYQDTGYYRLRNNYCAVLNNSSIASYIDDHVKIVSTQFGITFPEKTVTAYKRLMSNGGNLAVQLNPSGNIPLNDLKYYKVADIIQALRLNIAINGTKLELGQTALSSTAKKAVANGSHQVEASRDIPRQQQRHTTSPILSKTIKKASEPAYKTISVSNAEHYIGKTVEITMIEGKVRRGILEKANKDRLHLTMKLRGGTLTYPVETTYISKIRVQN